MIKDWGNMRHVLVVVLVSASLPFIAGQFQARNNVPDTIQDCYTNTTAYNRFTRQPMHIDNLIAIIKKIEDKTYGQWDARRIARTLVNRYMFDGMEYHGHAKPEFQFSQKPEELAKSLIIKSLIPIPQEEILPDYTLDNDEKCALHWMLSHSMNATMRDDELPTTGTGFGYPGTGTGTGYQNNNGNVGSGTGYNNGYSPYNNNNNNYNTGSNGNPNNMGSNQWGNRGKRDVAGENVNSTNSDENRDLSKEVVDGSGTDIKNKDYEESISAEETKDYENSPMGARTLDSNNTKLTPNADADVLDFDIDSTSSGKIGKQMSAQQQVDYKKRTRRPIEAGVVYTKWGPVAAGRLIAGIAAGLEPTSMSINGGAVYKPEASYGGTNPWSSGSGLGNGNSGYGSAGNNGNTWNSTNGGGQYPGQQQPQYSNQQGQYYGRRKRQAIQAQNLTPLESLYAATLAGDAGQAAILNAKNEMGGAQVPTGQFNDTVCPREYILYEHLDPSKEIYRDAQAWTYLTEAEIRGGVDGIILGSNIRRWDPSYTLRLSSILREYYSESGISGEPQFRSCDRGSLLSRSIDGNKLKEQTRSFAYFYSNKTHEVSGDVIGNNPTVMERMVEEAYSRMYQTASTFSSTGPGCIKPITGQSNNDINDDQKYLTPKLTVYGVLDHSANILEIDQQKRFLGELAYQLNVSPQGSRLGVVDGSTGGIIISPNWTDVSSIAACRILSLNSQPKSQDYARVLQGMRSELEKLRSEERRTNYTNQNGIVVLLLVQGRRLEDNQRNDIIRITNEINRDVYGGVSVVATSTKYQESDFQGMHFIKLQQGAQNFSDMADEFAQDLVRNTHGAFRYLYCNAKEYNQDNEHKDPTTMYFTPGTISYFKISPDYFFSSRSLILRFTSDNGRLRVCISRKEWHPKLDNMGSPHVECRDTSGNYVVPGQSTVDAEFRDGFLHQPCGKKGKLEGCDPIYISISPISSNAPGTTGLDCSVEKCESPDQVKMTFTHWDMRCNGAMRTMLSTTIALIAVFISLVNWAKAT